MSRRRFRRARSHAADLNITAFMNLMVILVPFLLITAVFSRMAILELDGPATGVAEQPPAPELAVTIRADALEVVDPKTDSMVRLSKRGDVHDYKRLTAALRAIKARDPERTRALIRAQPDTPYQTVVEVMDAVRLIVPEDGTTGVFYALFPNIAIGDASPVGTVKH